MRRILQWWQAPGRDIAVALLALAVLVYVANPALVRETRLRGFDMAQHIWPLPPGDSVVQIVAIDEDSLKREGQWPWPRTLVAELVRRIGVGKPLALGIDILFPEPDRFSPPRLARTVPDLPGPAAEELARMPSSEARLAEAIAAVPTVLSAAPSDEAARTGAQPSRVSAIRQVGEDPRRFLPGYNSMIRSLPEIAHAARAEAAITDEPDDDGLVRAVPLLTAAQGQLIPTLAVEAVRVAAEISSIAVTTGSRGIERVSIGPFSVPTDSRGRAYLRFGPLRVRYISAGAVLDPDFDTSRFEGRIVLLGVTGLGILDQKMTPFGLTQGIDLHAQLIDSIIGGTLLHRPPAASWLEFAVILAAGFAVIGLVRYDSPRLAATAALGIGIGLIAGELALFRLAGWLVDGIYPASVAMIAFGAMLGGNLREVQTARRRLAGELEQERQRAARMEGELAAARAIQMALLPHRFPAFPERDDIDLHARIEPARAVGGDLFDFLLVDESRLFFIIADVSGKGVPAALFMAMTKEVVRAAVQRHGAALDQVLAEANAKTAAASAEMDMMFVTAFAGILDLASGELTYASAGHDRPFLLYDGNGPRQLDTDGGPPLGVLEDFLYPIDSDRLEEGAVLLLYTDGVTEAQDGEGGFYTVGRLSAALTAAPKDSAEHVVDACFEAVRRFVGDAEPADDITVLAIRRAA